jgi:aminoglycoside phosphotransferase (APT) family kinase protein
MGRVARALARLHAARLSPGADAAPRSVDHWCGEVWRRRNKIARIDAPSGDRASRIVDAIESAAGPLAMRPLGLIHGDFHPDQVWVAEGRIVLFDFDEFSLGDPMEDLAEFIVKLEQGGAAPALAEALIRHYADAAPDRFDRRSLAWHLAVQSLLQATRAFVYQQPGWADVLDRRLAASEVRAAALPRTGAMP